MTLDPRNLAWARPARGTPSTGALVVAGSSGRIDTARIDMLARHGVTALGMRWFGGEGLPSIPRDVPLELFAEAIALLARECDRVVLMGLSYGAEALLLTAANLPALAPEVADRVDGLVALAPTHVAWEGDRTSSSDAPRSKWSQGGAPLPYVPLDRTWTPDTEPPAFSALYETSEKSAPAHVLREASIPVERIAVDLLLVAGEDDQVWPAARSARIIAARRANAGLPTTLVIDRRAGHPVALPGEEPASMSRPYAVGGDGGAPARLGRAAWPHIARMLRLEDAARRR